MSTENKNNTPLAIKLEDLQIVKDYVDGKIDGAKEETTNAAKEYTDEKVAGVIKRRTLWSMSDPDNGELVASTSNNNYSVDGILIKNQMFDIYKPGLMETFRSDNWIEVVYSIQPYTISEDYYGGTNKVGYQKRVLFRRISDGGGNPIEEMIGVGHTMQYTQIFSGIRIKYLNDEDFPIVESTAHKLYIHEVNELY